MIPNLFFPWPVAVAVVIFLDIFTYEILLLYYRSLFYSIVYGSILHVFIFRFLLQQSLIKQRAEFFFGVTLAMIASQLLGYNLYIVPYVSTYTSLGLILPIAFAYTQLMLSFRITKPQHLTCLSSTELARQIIVTSPAEGPQEIDLDAERNDPYDLKKKPPRICTVCMVDKRLATTHCKYCDLCVIGLDHHDQLLNNCVGKGELYHIH